MGGGFISEGNGIPAIGRKKWMRKNYTNSYCKS